MSASGSFARGFLVALTNPKTILFFGAFLPQFVSGENGYAGQVLLLSATFLLLAAVLDSLYAVMAGRVAGWLQGRHIRRLQDAISGSLFLGAAAWLAVIRRTQAA